MENIIEMDKVGKIKLPKTVAVFGGSFDPPTLAHVQVASEIYKL